LHITNDCDIINKVLSKVLKIPVKETLYHEGYGLYRQFLSFKRLKSSC